MVPVPRVGIIEGDLDKVTAVRVLSRCAICSQRIAWSSVICCIVSVTEGCKIDLLCFEAGAALGGLWYLVEGVGGAAVIAFVPSYARAASQNPTPLVIPSRIKNSTTRGGLKIDRIVAWAWGDLSMHYLGFPQKRKRQPEASPNDQQG